ncbi:MAG: TonB-dependent receptor [Bacteroidetes bacterium]|nr:TonB-dependent receptor [Bacteroidota bacterium]
MNRKLFTILFLGCTLFFVTKPGNAQDTTNKKRSVSITSSFKPVLKQSAKINFGAAPPTADTSRPKLNYDIPNQNLLFAYQPGTLKPMALQIDTSGRWDNTSYIKAGFGSLKTPYVQAGFSFGDGKTNGLNIYAKHVSSEGKREFQKFSNTAVSLDGFIQTAKNMEWDARLTMQQDQTYKYGYEPQNLNFLKDSLRQRFQTIGGRVSMHNINKTAYDISYAPEVKIDVFSDNHKVSESNSYVNLPLSKRVGDNFQVDLGLTFDLTRLSKQDKKAFNNTVYYISPSVSWFNQNINLKAGIRPSWDNKEFKLLPNITAEISTPDRKFTFLAGWTAYIRKTTYQYLASINPWLWAPDTLANSRIEERFAGFKGSLGNHFTYSAKVGFNTIHNQPLFINIYNDEQNGGKSFRYVNEIKMNVLSLSGQLGYTQQEKFSFIGSFTLNQFGDVKTPLSKAYGMLPLEIKGALRYLVIKDLWLTSDIFGWGGSSYLTKSGSSDHLSSVFDMNAGLEFRITKNLNLWTQFNNLFNKEYQRWNQYPVYGFNFVAGVVFSFAQKN